SSLPAPHLRPFSVSSNPAVTPTRRQARISKYILHFPLPYAILTLLISAVFLLLYLHRFKASHFRPVPHRNIYPTMNVTIDRMTKSLMTEGQAEKRYCVWQMNPRFEFFC